MKPREIAPADLLSAQKVDAQGFGAGWDGDDYFKFLSGRGRALVVGEVRDVRAVLWFRPTRHGVELETIATARRFRGRGYGTSLLKALRKLIPSRALFGWVRESNTRALALYKRLGFTVTRREEKVFGKEAGLRIRWSP